METKRWWTLRIDLAKGGADTVVGLTIKSQYNLTEKIEMLERSMKEGGVVVFRDMDKKRMFYAKDILCVSIDACEPEVEGHDAPTIQMFADRLLHHLREPHPL